MFFFLCALPTLKNKTLTLEELITALCHNNLQIQAQAKEQLAYKSQGGKALSSFLPKVTIGSAWQKIEERKEQQPIVLDDNGHPPIQTSRSKTGKWQDQSEIYARTDLNLFNGFRDVAALKAGKFKLSEAQLKIASEIAKTFLEAVDILLKANATLINMTTNKSLSEGSEKVYIIAFNKFQNKAIALGEFKNAEAARDAAYAQTQQYISEYTILISEFFNVTGLTLDETQLTTLEMPKNIPSSYEEAEARMLKNNFAIRIAQARIKQKEAEVVEAHSAFLPSINLQAQYKRPLNIPEHLKEEKSDTSLSIQSSWNLFNGFTDTANVRSASHGLNAARCQYYATVNNSKSQLKRLWTQYHTAQDKRKLLESAVNGYEIHLNSMITKFEAGAKNVPDVNQANQSLAHAKSSWADNEKLLYSSAMHLTILLGDLHPILQKLVS